MEADFPAAHSMDTVWFAVDSAGQVGLFCTGENGHLPEGPDTDVREALWARYGPEGSSPEAGWEPETLCLHAGVYLFDYSGSDLIYPYGCGFRPELPLHIDQLPPTLRQRCRTWAFEVRFDEGGLVQPLEFVPCVFWYSNYVAYLCGDNITVKPIPGREGQFDAFVDEFWKHYPSEARRFFFDGPMKGI